MNATSMSAFRIAVVATVIGLFFVTAGYGQTEKGDFEVGIEVGPSLVIATGGHEAIGALLLAVEPHAGYFLTDALAVGATVFLFRPFDSDPSQSAISFGAAYAYVNYHFNAGGTWSPYVGGRLGVFNANSAALFAASAQAGLQFFAARQFSINLQLEVGTIAGSAGSGSVFLSTLGIGMSYHIK
ncbi:MAG: hypothetical protein KF749_01510 [Bacteroidetes bacterium]|nr:hypothetical protein [Bacteroidota bacterium]MCW5896191.1 hypothetical protein [Bacteroidota bacterium]